VARVKKVGKVKKVWKVICEEVSNAFAAFSMGRGYSCGEGSTFLSEEGALLREMAVQKARELKDKCARIKSAPRRIRGRFMIFLDSRRQVQPGANSLLRDADRVYLRKTLGLVQLRQLGEGANGAVFGGRFYYKRPDGVEKRIVVKVMEDGYSQSDMEAKMSELLRNESHNNIVATFGTYQSTERVYILLEKSPIGDLYGYFSGLPNGQVDEAVAVKLFEQMVNGTKHLHNLGYSHNDIKFDNFLVFGAPGSGPDQVTVKLADFGGCLECYRFDRKNNRKPIFTAKTRGTPITSAPEIGLAPPQADAPPPTYDISKVDVYSLGCCLFKLLNGRSPFGAVIGNGLSHDEILDIFRVVKLKMELVPWNASVSIEAKSLILSLLECTPGHRMLLDDILGHEWCRKYA